MSWIDKDSGECVKCGALVPGDCRCLSLPKKVRSPQDILDEVAEEERKQFEELLAECNRRLPRAQGLASETETWRYKDHTVTRVIGELRKAGWKSHKHYNNIRVEFPDDVAKA